MQTDVLIVGASISGLSSAVSLQKHGIEYTIIEKQSQLGSPWRNHYERLHLHTNKRVSNLPFKKFGKGIPRYPSRQQVVDYLEDYAREFNIVPRLNTEARSISKVGNYWTTETNSEQFQSRYIIIATGPFSKPKPIDFKGRETFTGKILHSQEYKTGKEFEGQRVLVVGFGNSACEIAIDLYEQGAFPSMSVRSPVNVIPRDLLGFPILELSQFMSKLPPRFADKLNAPLLQLATGNISKLGLKRPPYGPLEQIARTGSAPVLDIGTIKHIRQGHIQIYGGIDYIENSTVHFIDKTKKEFDAIVAGIGFYRDYAEFVNVGSSRFKDLRHPLKRQKLFGKDGLYFCGFFISPTGQIREIAKDAQAIADHISQIR